MDKTIKTVFRKKAADPVKDKTDIALIYKRMKKRNRNREAELFLIGCNVALRISDLLRLEFDKIREEIRNGHLVGYADIQEKKTGKPKRVTFNTMAIMAVRRLRESNPEHVYLFQATGNRVGTQVKPVRSNWINRVFSDISEDLELNFSFSSHSMRKTFGYHAYKDGLDINVLQKLFNHSSVQDTFIYIGITEERVSEAYLDFQLSVEV